VGQHLNLIKLRDGPASSTFIDREQTLVVAGSAGLF